MSKRYGVTWGGNRRENPQDCWPDTGVVWHRPKPRVTTDYGRHVAKIKSQIHKYFGPCAYDSKVTADGVQIKFRMPSMRAWMDGMIAMKKADKNRKRKWVPKMACAIGETISQILFSPYVDAEIEVYAEVDDTLPPEGEMTEKELEIIYGR